MRLGSPTSPNLNSWASSQTSRKPGDGWDWPSMSSATIGGPWATSEAVSRRALFEKRPVVVNSVIENPNPSYGYDWELDWPAILYAPVGEVGGRPTGLLTLGCRRDHWYSEDDVNYAASLGVALAPMVAALRGPLARLNEIESEVAQLLSYGLSESEIARAIRFDEHRTRALVDGVTRKLKLVATTKLAVSFAERPARRRRLGL